MHLEGAVALDDLLCGADIRFGSDDFVRPADNCITDDPGGEEEVVGRETS